MGLKLTVIILAAALSGCATAQNPAGTAIISYNTVKNAQQLTGAGVRAELNQGVVNMLRAYNRSQGGF